MSLSMNDSRPTQKMYNDVLRRKDAMERELNAANAEIDKLREALRPFAEVVTPFEDDVDSRLPLRFETATAIAHDVTLGDLRRASKALEERK